ncbi:histidine phosphatase family protein [Sulfitobacter sp. KE34]|uniref:Histidine phosphatase family protein n=1 Tax=Sulfitobacter faviae TaxID=1775881 RepID=A0AAX3LT70_9RHOB|nr:MULTISPECIES: histidine phosphatase family protein [Sulfitobacter]MDF3350400.1 histidine phosphatase family protein [Sulfitobacter sp. KE12]MDF3354397.1 histidine phosphatase family protein [Sulfitobacter sp. KE27]MDF3357720.1 histidine phosphatase family protein [Sulfitobacter sp. KE33]MDF3360127.1 histidine phosphatase family protein [Sulfitobacter sp. Ks41]MDF3365469.1 histidine phosphatase family protein [Sulfitobacter sp. Ks34]
MTAAALPSRSFCLIRHGETTANADEIIAGVTDVPLTEAGRDQACLLSQRIWPEPIAIYASPMSRAQDTARLAFPGQRIELHDGLRERDWGVFEGRPLSDQPLREATPDRGESWHDMLKRVQIAIRGICAASPTALPVLVCHSGVIRAARVLWTTGDVGQRPPNATPLLFEIAENKLLEQTL